MLIEPRCAACGRRASRIELLPPGELPADWERWPEDHRQVYLMHRKPREWYFRFESIEAANGLVGDPIPSDKASRIAAAFAEPFSYEKIRTVDLFDDAGFCEACGAFYCYDHWDPSTTGYGRCPQGHGKGLEPHWSPA